LSNTLVKKAKNEKRKQKNDKLSKFESGQKSHEIREFSKEKENIVRAGLCCIVYCSYAQA